MYRILTEYKNVDAIRALLAGLRLDFTVYCGDGSWRGQAENSMLIELDMVSADLAEEVARLIKQTNTQESVLLQEIPTKSRLI